MNVHTVTRSNGIAPKRGDLAIRVETGTDYFIGQPSRDFTHVTLGTVTSVSRSGDVLAASWPFSNDAMSPKATPTKNLFRGTIHTVPSASVDMAGLFADYAEHTWPGHDSQIMPYADNADARAIIQAHRI